MTAKIWKSPNPRYYAAAVLVLTLGSMFFPVMLLTVRESTWAAVYLNECLSAAFDGAGGGAMQIWAGAGIVQIFTVILYSLYLLKRVRFPSIRIPILIALIYAICRGLFDGINVYTYRPPFDSSLEMWVASGGLASLAGLACQILFIFFLYWQLTPAPVQQAKAAP